MVRSASGPALRLQQRPAAGYAGPAHAGLLAAPAGGRAHAPLLLQVLDRNVEHLSGGELQRFAIAVVAAQTADVYMIDEPSSYLDVKQRLKAAQVRRGAARWQ
jgi:ABC-type glutathione transport system ATPase component